MLQHVWERANMARYLSKVVIATDDLRIADEARRFKANVRMTRSDHLTGTDRVAEAASADSADYVVNIQGDEPLIDPSAIDAVILSVLGDPEVPMGTLKKRIEMPRLGACGGNDELDNPNVVKVVTDHYNNALYFSRHPIPFVREKADQRATPWYKHIGLYIYRREFLLGYSSLDPGPLEQLERLEQLRALENGFKIRVVETEYDSLGVDTPEDLAKVAALFQMTEARPLHGDNK